MRLKLEINNNVAVITMDDGKVNALDNDWFKQMLSLLDQVEASDAHALVLSGREGIFSGGLNVKWLPTMDKLAQTEFSQLFSSTLIRLYQFPKPTIAALTGHGIAGGCLLACACDQRLAVAGEYNIAMNEVLINMTIPGWAIRIIQDVIPKPYSNDVLNLAKFVSFDEAHTLGVIKAIYPDIDSLMENALKLAGSYSNISLRDFAATKRQVRPL